MLLVMRWDLLLFSAGKPFEIVGGGGWGEHPSRPQPSWEQERLEQLLQSLLWGGVLWFWEGIFDYRRCGLYVTTKWDSGDAWGRLCWMAAGGGPFGGFVDHPWGERSRKG